MKRSEINRAVQRAVELLGQEGIGLPAFGYWKLEDWKQNRDRLEIIRQTMLGWDVTDFSSGDFLHTGSVLFTIRNGSPSGTGTPYAEKLIFQRHETEQEIPFHFHRIKTEDIINGAEESCSCSCTVPARTGRWTGNGKWRCSAMGSGIGSLPERWWRCKRAAALPWFPDCITVSGRRREQGI